MALASDGSIEIATERPSHGQVTIDAELVTADASWRLVNLSAPAQLPDVTEFPLLLLRRRSRPTRRGDALPTGRSRGHHRDAGSPVTYFATDSTLHPVPPPKNTRLSSTAIPM